MFGFNKQKRMIEGPIEFEAEVAIDRSAAEVFPLVDIAHPRFAHIQRGAEIKGSGSSFTMSLEEIGDAVFEFTVLERVEGQRHKAQSVMVPQLFALVKAVKDYALEPTGDSSCVLKLLMSAEFDAELSDEEVAGEIAMMSAAVDDDLTKLKVLAEDGIDALKAMEETDTDFDGDWSELGIDWGDIDAEQ